MDNINQPVVAPKENTESLGVDVAEIGSEIAIEVAGEGILGTIGESAGDLLGGLLDGVSIDI